MQSKALVLRIAGSALVLALVGAACSSGPAESQATTSGQATEESSSMAQGSSGEEGVESGAAQLQRDLTYGLTEHEYLAGIAVAMGVEHGLDSAQFEAAAAALDENSQDLSGMIGSVYGDEAGDQFLELWRAHIGFFVDYTEGVATVNDRKADSAKRALDGYRADFGAFIDGATQGGLSKAAVADALNPHVQETIKAIDAVAGVRDGNPFLQLKKAAGHMPHIATVLADAIAQQFPDQF